MTNQDLNRRFAELCGLCWHERVDSDGFCSCGAYHPAHLPDNCPNNPDFISDPRLVLREMMKRPDCHDFLMSLAGHGHYLACHMNIDYILDTTGLFVKAGIEFLENKDQK